MTYLKQNVVFENISKLNFWTSTVFPLTDFIEKEKCRKEGM